MAITISGTGNGSINNLTVPTASGAVVGSGTNYPLNIDSSATAESLKIDSSGRITAPNRVMFYARKASGNADVTSGNSFTANFDTKEFDVGNGFNTTTGEYTAPVAGNYCFVLCAFVYTGASGRIDFFKNSTGVGRFGREYTISAPSYFPMECTIIIDMAANDTFDADVTTGTMRLSSSYNYFSGFLIG
jgi:hypothetical protein